MSQHRKETQIRESQPVLSVGSVVDGRFEVIGYLGCGGMGSVYRATHLQMDRDVAIKVLHPRFTSDLSSVQRFQREAHIVSTLKHANILTIYSFGVHEDFIYIAMEFVEGQSLGQVIERAALPVAQAIPLLIEICDAMAHAHSNGVLHRDLKPDNVMVAKDSSDNVLSAKVVDFGLSKLADSHYGKRLTATGEVVGDPRYMSPEQCRGEQLDVRSDIYSFGCLMYEVMTGTLPFDADSAVGIMHKHISETPPTFAAKLELPEGLESIVFNTLGKHPKHRYESFEQVLKDLKKVGASEDVMIPLRYQPARPFPVARMVRALTGLLLTMSVISALVLGWNHLLLAREWFAYIALSPTNLDRIANAAALGRGYAHEGDEDRAIHYYTEAGELATKELNFAWIARVYGHLGDLYARKHRSLEAEQTYARSLWGVQALLYKGETSDEMYALACSSLQGLSQISPPQAVRFGGELSALYSEHKMVNRARQILELSQPR